MGENPITDSFNLSSEKKYTTIVKITVKDIIIKIRYWNSTVIFYILDSNPPQIVMNGYFRRIRKGMVIDKIAQVNMSVFLVRFQYVEDHIKAVEEGVQMFDRKPIVVKPLKHICEITKEIVDKVPIWIKMLGLGIKYWRKSALTKIAGMSLNQH